MWQECTSGKNFINFVKSRLMKGTILINVKSTSLLKFKKFLFFF
jgi:hypothetical protein